MCLDSVTSDHPLTTHSWAEPLVPVRLADGRQALLVTRDEDVGTLLADPRFSREAWANGTLFARHSSALALVTGDAPSHTRRRRAVRSWFTRRSAEQARPRITAIADRLLDAVEAAGPPVDLIAGFTTPLPYQVVCDMLGVPFGDLDRLPRVTATMSAGRYPSAEVTAAHEAAYGYFFERLAEREWAVAAGTPGDDLLTALLTAPERDRLSAKEIAVFGFGLLMACGEATACHLATCVSRVLRDPGLADSLRRDPAGIPAVVEELLRWVWFAGTAGQAHVVVEDVVLAGTVLGRGQVVIPFTDATHRGPAASAEPDRFRPDRAPKPHLGFGHGRQLWLGAAHARVELQVGLAALLRRLDRLELDVDESRVDGRDGVSMRGVWRLPVRWRTREPDRDQPVDPLPG